MHDHHRSGNTEFGATPGWRDLWIVADRLEAGVGAAVQAVAAAAPSEPEPDPPAPEASVESAAVDQGNAGQQAIGNADGGAALNGAAEPEAPAPAENDAAAAEPAGTDPEASGGPEVPNQATVAEPIEAGDPPTGGAPPMSPQDPLAAATTPGSPAGADAPGGEGEGDDVPGRAFPGADPAATAEAIADDMAEIEEEVAPLVEQFNEDGGERTWDLFGVIPLFPITDPATAVDLLASEDLEAWEQKNRDAGRNEAAEALAALQPYADDYQNKSEALVRIEHSVQQQELRRWQHDRAQEIQENNRNFGEDILK